MARLPSQDYLIQEIEGEVVLFEANSGSVVLRFDPYDIAAVARAQKTIYDSGLSDEDKAFAHLWSGYFYAHAGGAQSLVDVDGVLVLMEELAKALKVESLVVSGPVRWSDAVKQARIT